MTLPAGMFSRRQLLASSLSIAPLAALGACATPMGRYTVEEGVRRLLELSCQRAFARLTEPGGFYDDQLTRIVPPDMQNGRGGAVVSAILRTRAVRDRVGMALNDMAADLADNAAPYVLDAVRRMSVADALTILRGGPTAATDLLEEQAHDAVIDALLPGVSRGLRSDLFEILSAALTTSSGADFAALADNVTQQIGGAIFHAIGREEREIRADPRATHDPVLIALLTPGHPLP